MNTFFTRQAQSITGAAILLGCASFLSRLIGLVRDRIFAHHFGAGDILDAYYAAFRIPDFLFNLLLAGALTAGFVPIFLELWQKDPQKSWALTNRILRVVAITMAIAGIVGWLIAPYAVPYITPGFSGEKLALTIELTRILMLSPLLMGVSGVLSGVLHARRQFTAFAFAPLIYNLAIIGGVVFLVPHFGPIALAWGVVIGALLHLLIQIPALVAGGFTLKTALDYKDAAVKKMIGLILPRTFSLATVQINFFILDSLASTLASGSIAVFYLAHNLYYVPIGLIGHAFALAAFPVFAAAAAEKNYDELKKQVARVIRQILFLIIPAMLIVILLRAQIVRVALGSGNFDWADTVMTADVLAVLAISLAAHCITLVVARALYALQDIWITFWISAGGVLLTTVVGILLKPHFGILGLSGALSLSLIIQCAAMWFVLHQKLGGLEEAGIIKALTKISIAGAVMGLVTQTLKTPLSQAVDMTRLWGILSQGLISGTLGLLVYGLVCHWLHLEEAQVFWTSFQRRWLKVKTVTDTIE